MHAARWRQARAITGVVSDPEWSNLPMPSIAERQPTPAWSETMCRASCESRTESPTTEPGAIHGEGGMNRRRLAREGQQAGGSLKATAFFGQQGRLSTKILGNPNSCGDFPLFRKRPQRCPKTDPWHYRPRCRQSLPKWPSYESQLLRSFSILADSTPRCRYPLRRAPTFQFGFRRRSAS